LAEVHLDAFDAGRHALSALVSALPRLPAEAPLVRALQADPRAVREALSRLVPWGAFVLATEARGLVAGGAEGRLLELVSGGLSGVGWTEPAPWLGEHAPALVRSVIAALRERTPATGYAALPAEALGAFHEGTLGVALTWAAEPMAVIRPRKRAGDAALEVAVGLETLSRVAPKQRGAHLRALGAELDTALSTKISRARSATELGVLLAQSRSARARVVDVGHMLLLATAGRRRSGSHYTPPELARDTVASALAPLLGARPSAADVLGLSVCDPALGTGAFAIAVCRYLAQRLELAERNAEHVEPGALRRVVERCVYGVDSDATAVEVAKASLWLLAADPSLPLGFLDRALVHGEALRGAPNARAATPAGALDWPQTFSHVFDRGGFDAFVGNPPWVSYVGRAAQPLPRELRVAYSEYEAFSGYRNLQGLFVERAARLLRPFGRLGFVLPSSMSELTGYAPTRRAHDRFAEPDAVLSDRGPAAFEGVFQPCMVLCSTRRAAPLADVEERPWPLERPDLDASARALLAKLAREPLPPRLFGERGLQSMGDDKRHLARAPDALHSVPLRAGADIEPFRLRPPSFYADPRWFQHRLRPESEWRRVRVVVRQTARIPIAALSDGVGFRNSLLAGFDDTQYPAEFLVAYLNSNPIRWLHYVRHRDARQGMPQLKVAHLRATPAPPRPTLITELESFGARVSSAGRAIDARDQAELDGLVADAFELDANERERVARWSESLA
jgi:hypothetical protein